MLQCLYLIHQQDHDFNKTTKMSHVYITCQHTIIITSEILSLTIGVIKVFGNENN